MKYVAIVEGHGEVEAVQNLLVRLSGDLALPMIWDKPKRYKNLHQWSNPNHGGIERILEFYRNDPIDGMLILRDEDDECPKELAPSIADNIRDKKLPFPVAYVLLNPEYEVLFLPNLHHMPGEIDGRACISSDAIWPHDTDWEAKRGIKEWLSKHYPKGKTYKPTMDQLFLTQKIDFETTRKSGLSCFGSLERGLIFLSKNKNTTGKVYPWLSREIS